MEGLIGDKSLLVPSKLLICVLVACRSASHKRDVAELFDMRLRACRRDRAARVGTELFLHDRVLGDCLERISLMNVKFGRALLIGCPSPTWRTHLESVASEIEASDPGPVFASASRGFSIVEDAWEPSGHSYDLVLAIGTLDTVNDLPLALRLIATSMRPGGLFIGAVSGGDTLPRLRAAMRAADLVSGFAAPHVHPRIEASSLAPLLEASGFARPVVDIERVQVSYSSLGRLVSDLRAMGATNVLTQRAPPLTRLQIGAAEHAFAAAGAGSRTIETFEVVHFAAWAPAAG